MLSAAPACCCGDATCDGSCHGDAADEAHEHDDEAHEHDDDGHSHE